MKWLDELGVKTTFIKPGNPWENVYNESFNGKLRDEHLNCELFSSLKEAQVLTENWRNYNHVPRVGLSVGGGAAREAPHSNQRREEALRQFSPEMPERPFGCSPAGESRCCIGCRLNRDTANMRR